MNGTSDAAWSNRSQGFDRLSDHAFETLPTDLAVRYIAEARNVGDTPAARRAQLLLAAQHRHRVRRRILRRVPRSEVEDLTSVAIEAAGKGVFRGHSLREFLSWLGTIAHNKVCDHYRACDRVPELVPLAEHDCPGRPEQETDASVMEFRTQIRKTLGGMRPDHQRIVALSLASDRSTARDVAARAGTTEVNVYQIVSRFRKRLRDTLEAVSVACPCRNACPRPRRGGVTVIERHPCHVRSREA